MPSLGARLESLAGRVAGRVVTRAIAPGVVRAVEPVVAGAVGPVLAETAEIRRILGEQADASDDSLEILGRTLTRLSAEVAALSAEVRALQAEREAGPGAPLGGGPPAATDPGPR